MQICMQGDLSSDLSWLQLIAQLVWLGLGVM
jgi:hypothetical protein